MFASFTRGWVMAKASWAVLKDQPSLAVFPVISVIAAAALSVALVVPVAAGGVTAVGLGLPDKALQALGYAALFAWYFLCTFAFVFCNSALVACALQRFAGQPATVGSGFAAARRRLPQILGWSLLAATVGVILRGLQSVLKEKAGFVGELVAGVAEGLWGVAIYFVIPVVVTEGLGPVEAVKRSSSILRRTWGESLSGTAGLNIIMFLFFLPAIGVAALIRTGIGGSAVMVTLAVLCGLYLLVLAVVFAALGSIFRAGVYSYATSGVAPAHMDADLLQATFRSGRAR
jgi:hypothetical protein